MPDARVGVVGGSIAGCVTASVLARAGFEVTILERSSRRLEERGSGIVLPMSMIDLLKTHGLVDADYEGVPVSRREWRSTNGHERGRIAFVEPMMGQAQHWGVLYRQFRARVPDSSFQPNSMVTGLQSTTDGVTLTLADGSAPHFNMVVGADGYRSTVRQLLMPRCAPIYAGYPAWRGVVAESSELDLDDIAGTVQMVGVPTGHAAFYVVPGHNGALESGRRRLNWIIYDGTASTELIGAATAGAGSAVADAVSPGRMTSRQRAHLHALARDHLPPLLRDVVLATPEPYAQSLYDLTVPSYAVGNTCLVGDAGAIARPHTASGTSKAVQDALALAEAISASPTLEQGLARYSEARTQVGNDLVALGQALGSEQVLRAPEWNVLDQEGFKALLSGGAGRRTYFVSPSTTATH